MKPNTIQAESELKSRKDRLEVYIVTVGNIYGFSNMTDQMRIKVGFGSSNHWQTINDLVNQKWGSSGAIVKQVKTAKQAKSDIGIGVDYPY